MADKAQVLAKINRRIDDFLRDGSNEESLRKVLSGRITALPLDTVNRLFGSSLDEPARGAARFAMENIAAGLAHSGDKANETITIMRIINRLPDDTPSTAIIDTITGWVPAEES